MTMTPYFNSYSNVVTVSFNHVKNLQNLMIEIYNALNNMNPSIVSEFYENKCVTYDLRKKEHCTIPEAKTTS